MNVLFLVLGIHLYLRASIRTLKRKAYQLELKFYWPVHVKMCAHYLKDLMFMYAQKQSHHNIRLGSNEYGKTYSINMCRTCLYMFKMNTMGILEIENTNQMADSVFKLLRDKICVRSLVQNLANC